MKILPLVLVCAGLIAPATALRADTPDELIVRGETQMQAQDIAGAIATLTRAIEMAPESSLAHTRLGGAYLLDQQYDAAIVQFQQAISADGNNANAFVGMAVAYLHSDRVELAKAALLEAKRVDPSKAASINETLELIEQRGDGAGGPAMHQP